MTEDTSTVVFVMMLALMACIAIVAAYSERQDATETRKLLRGFARTIRYELKRQPDANVRPCIERIADMMEEAAE